MTTPVAGIFVGGSGVRMGGIAKGLLRTASGATIVERLRAMLQGVGMEVVLVGERDEYAGLGIEVIADQPAGIGPLGGLVALLERAGDARAVALGCDMPFVSGSLIERLLTASPGASIVAPRREGRWEPLCARYDGSRVLPRAQALVDSRDLSLQRLLHQVGAVELRLTAEELDELRDWDRPEDVG